MIEKHILHIGMMRSASTWLWRKIKEHPHFDQHGIPKEQLTLYKHANDFSEYHSIYKKFFISANFHPNLCLADTSVISYLNQYATHVSLTVRNPFDLASRIFNFMKYHNLNDQDNLMDIIVFEQNFVRYADIINRWKTHCPNAKFKLMFFDDVVSQPYKFLTEWFDFVDMYPIYGDNPAQPINSLDCDYNFNFTHDQTDFINEQIQRFAYYTNRDIGSWYR